MRPSSAASSMTLCSDSPCCQYRQPVPVTGRRRVRDEILNQAADAGESVVNPTRLGALYGSLCDSYLVARDFRRAKLAATRSMKNFEAADNKRMIGEVHNRLGRAFAQTGQLDAATEHLEHAHQIAEQEDDTRGLAEAERGLAAVYVQQNRIDQAAAAASHALALSGELDDAVEHAGSLLMQAHVDEAQKDFAAAEKNSRRRPSCSIAPMRLRREATPMPAIVSSSNGVVRAIAR